MTVQKLKLQKFLKELGRYEREVPQRIVNGYQGAVMRQLYMYLVLFTPIDTGALRGNWKVGIDSMPRGASKHRLTDATVTGAPPTGAEIAYVEAFNKTLNALPLGRTVYLGNFLNYAKFIEFGYTHVNGKVMAPVAMLERAKISILARIYSGNIRWKKIGS